MNEVRLSNPTDKYGLRLTYIGALGIFVGGSSPVLIHPVYPVFLVVPIMGIFSILCLWAGYRKNVSTRPVFVTVRDDGVVLEFRRGNERFLQWSQIKDVYSKPGPKETRSGRGIGMGAIRVNGQRTIYLITYEIASALTERYIKAMGRPPVTWSGQASY